MKKLKLYTHKLEDFPFEVYLNPKDLFNTKNGDILEIKQPQTMVNSEPVKILVQIKDNDSNIIPNLEINAISISENRYEKGSIRKGCDVEVSVVEGNTIDFVELIFKDQYYSRADMWRMRSSLLKKLIHNGKKVELLGMSASVGEIWNGSSSVTSGVVSETSHVTFRSASAQVNIFIQMSCEMWNFDNYGDLYFECAVNGFLSDLFKLWHKESCCHDVSITLFSRNFYSIKSSEMLPKYAKLCLRQDQEGRYYEDFYRVVVQNERYKDWRPTLQKLRRIFNTYNHDVIQFHTDECIISKREYMNKTSGDEILDDNLHDVKDYFENIENSKASEGNVLEVMNMALNAFEKFHIDRCFDRTGKLLIIITPGNGVFDVNRELMNITKQRIIDCGGCCDLVCLAPQPIYIAPLFRFTKDKKEYKALADDFALAYWMNASYYISKAHRIAAEKSNYAYLNSYLLDAIDQAKKSAKEEIEQLEQKSNDWQLIQEMPIYDFSYHDKNIYKKKSTPIHINCQFNNEFKIFNGELKPRTWTTYNIGSMCNNNTTPLIIKPSDEYISTSFDGKLHQNSLMKLKSRPVAQSLNLPFLHQRRLALDKDCQIMNIASSLINPFAPSKLPNKITSNRRRWSHAHLTNTVFSQTHNPMSVSSRHASATSPLMEYHRISRISECNSDLSFKPSSLELPKYLQSGEQQNTSIHSNLGSMSDIYSSSIGRCRTLSSRPNLLPLPSYISESSISHISIPTELPIKIQEQKVDWKSMTIPALLPTTTDYFPDNSVLNSLFVMSSYTLVVEEEAEAQRSIVYGLRKSLTIRQSFEEMIFLRLAQGFQIVKQVKNESRFSAIPTPKISIISRLPTFSEEVKMSIGRVFHRLVLRKSSIVVETYRPKHPNQNSSLNNYTYRFMVPDSRYYDSSWTSFTITRPESYPWNYVDHHLLTRGEENDMHRVDEQKFWRARFFLLPNLTKKMENLSQFEPFTDFEKREYIQHFLKFAEFVNRMTKSIQSTHRVREANRRGSIASKPFSAIKGELLPRKATHIGGHQLLSPTKSNDGTYSNEDYFLQYNANSTEIIRCMMDQKDGLIFLKPHQDYVTLPNHCFSSHDAVTWLTNAMTGIHTVSDAMKIMQKLLDEKLICHASGKMEVPFIFGFYLYYIVSETSSHDMTHNSIGISVLQNCMEVEVVDEKHNLSWEVGDLEEKVKVIRMDLDSKSLREEWGVIEYQKKYSPDTAYRFSIQWLVATGSIIGDQIINYIRKAAQCQFQLLPAPLDAFALPFTPNSDPLRGPIYINLNVNEIGVDLVLEEMTMFQDAIVRSFGFILDRCSGSSVIHAGKFKRLIQYIHWTAGMFVMLVTLKIDNPPDKNNKNSHSQNLQNEYEEFIIRQATNRHNDSNRQPSSIYIGFLWSWNFMWTKKLSPSPNFEGSFQDKMLSDFKSFCSNEDNQLINYWNNYKK